MRRDFVEKWTYVAYICRNLYQIDLLKVRFLSYPWFYTRNIPKIMGTGAECRLHASTPSREREDSLGLAHTPRPWCRRHGTSERIGLARGAQPWGKETVAEGFTASSASGLGQFFLCFPRSYQRHFVL